MTDYGQLLCQRLLYSLLQVCPERANGLVRLCMLSQAQMRHCFYKEVYRHMVLYYEGPRSKTVAFLQ